MDTNVLVSAAIADGPPRRVLELFAERRAELILPTEVLAELRRVLGEKIGLDRASIAEIEALLGELGPVMAETPDEVEEASGDPDDDRILAAALSARSDVLVSGAGRHLRPLGEVGGMRTLKPQELLAEFVG